MLGPHLGLSDDAIVSENKVGAHDHPYVIHLQALAGVNTADFVCGLRRHHPQAAIFRQVPPHRELMLGNYDVFNCRILLTSPIPAVPGHHTRLVTDLVSLHYFAAQLLGRSEYSKIEFGGIQPVVGGWTDSQSVIKPR